MSHDVIVIGAGHNGLVAACYLARAGLDVLVVEAAAVHGGMTATSAKVTEAPEHQINSCALDAAFIRASNLVQDLNLAQFGCREIENEPEIVYLHPDGASIAFWRDARRTAEEIRVFSPADADAFLELSRTLNAMLAVGCRS